MGYFRKKQPWRTRKKRPAADKMQMKNNNRNSAIYQTAMELEERPPLPPRGPPLLLNHYRQQGSLDGYGPYSSVPAPKPVGRTSAVTPPPYRMPPHPLPPLPPLPGAVTDHPPPPSPAYHTHSNKFPIERELVLSSSDKNNKIPILSEYNKRPRSVVPEGPVKQVAWEREAHYQQAFNQDIVQQPAGDRENSYVSFNDPHHRHSVDLERGIRDTNDKTKISKTYYSIKDMISNRFSKSKENVNDSKQMNNQGVDSLAGPMQAISLSSRPQRPNPPLPVLRSPQQRPAFPDVQSPSCELLSPPFTPDGLSPPLHPNFSPSCEVLSPVPPATPLSAQQQERRMQQQRNDSHGVYATARAYVVQARPPAQRRSVRTAGPSTELSHSSPNLTANLESNGVYISKTPAKYPAAVAAAVKAGSETDDDGGFKKAPPLPDMRPPPQVPSEEPPPIPQMEKNEPGRQVEKVSSAPSSDYEKATRASSVGDSGRGSAAYSSGRAGSAELQRNGDPAPAAQTEVQRRTPNQRGKEWVDMVESELRQILDPKMQSGACSSTLSDSVSSLTPPLPPLSPGGGSSPTPTPRHTRYKNSSLPHGSRPEYDKDDRKYGSGSKNQRSNVSARREWSRPAKPLDNRSRQSSSSRSKLPPGLMSIETDLGSTTTGPLDSVLDSRLSAHSSDEDMSTTIDANDAMAIRRQLHGLENMYSEVLKLLGVKKYGSARYPGSEQRPKRRYGSMSSLPSSVSSRPVRDKRRDDRKKVRDIKGINKRFQRLESHVVTLARSVAHLSSEMRTQHLMIQEMENIRGEMAALRAQTGGNRSMSVPRALNSLMTSTGGDPRDPQALTNPSRVKKLTKFFGDEPPLLRIFLRRLGYEKYAAQFESEKIGMVELPYLTEERLQKMGIPMGPRLRILQEAQISFCRDSVYVV